MEKATDDKNMLVRKEENIRIIELGINERSEFFECQNQEQYFDYKIREVQIVCKIHISIMTSSKLETLLLQQPKPIETGSLRHFDKLCSTCISEK